MKTPGQIAYETFEHRTLLWIGLSDESRSAWEAAAQAVLSSQWRSVDDPPENELDPVIVGGGGYAASTSSFSGRAERRTHWMPIPALPEQTEEQKSRAKFEDFLSKAKSSGLYVADPIDNRLWDAWQAAFESKEESV